MTYRIYLRNDCKPEVRWENERPVLSFSLWVLFCLSAIATAYYFLLANNSANIKNALLLEPILSPANNEHITFNSDLDEKVSIVESPEHSRTKNSYKLSGENSHKNIKTEAKITWQSIIVKPGDSLALIFSRLGLSAASLHKIMSFSKEASMLKMLRPGDELKFNIKDNELIELQYEMDLTKVLKIIKKDNKFITEKIDIKLDSIVKKANGVINDSLFLSGQKAGLSDNLIMQLAAIFGWDIDFVLDIRKGDSYKVIYEEQYKDGKKVVVGPIIAAEFVNRKKVLRAVRYSENNQRSDYYAINGDAMRKAFLRTPVDFFSRISSQFSLGRKHPVLNKIRAHKGVDYAAPSGTPVRATGDGTVIFAGRDGGFGRTIKLKHGSTYSTVYAHLRKFAKNIRSGKEVKQGQVIGYVGQSGLATGPHLHYEFQIHGVHRNPLTVKLPKVRAISEKNLPKFKKAIIPMLAELEKINSQNVVTAQRLNPLTKKPNLKIDDG